MTSFDRAKAGQRLGARLPPGAIAAIPSRMIETLLFIAATAAAAPAAPQPAGQVEAPNATVSETRPAPCDILQNTFNAFVAVEESPDLREIVWSAIFIGIGKQRAIVAPSGAAWIS